MRELFCSNAAYWIGEFHLDGLRLDATQQMFDNSARHILGEIVQYVRKAGAPRRTLVVAENEPQDVGLVRPPGHGGYGADALWNDDFHHAAMVAATGRNEGYYTDYQGSPQELVSAAKWAYLSTRGSTIGGSESGAARPPSAYRPRSSSTIFRTTTRSRTPPSASASTG